MSTFYGNQPTWSAPAEKHAAVTPADGSDLPGGTCRSLYVGSGGTIVMQDSAGTQATWANVATGSIVPLMCKRVLATGTTATNILALY